jgi:D-methionine transport system permease protein
VVAAAKAMGASVREIVVKVLLREARPGLVSGLTVTVIALIGYSAMAGTVGGGGLGDVAVRFGYERFETEVMVATVVLLIVLVQAVQTLGDLVTRRLSRR